MSSIAIHLPLTARLSQVLGVIGKVAGEPWELRPVASSVQTDRPSAPDNDWSLAFTGTQGPLPSLRVTAMDADPSDALNRGRLSFRTLDVQRRNWQFEQESETEDAKILRAPSTPLSLALGRRLIEVFGGKVTSEKGKLFEVDSDDALLPPISPLQLASTRKFQFQNVLLALPLLRAVELDAVAYMAAETPREDQQLIDHLTGLEAGASIRKPR